MLQFRSRERIVSSCVHMNDVECFAASRSHRFTTDRINSDIMLLFDEFFRSSNLSWDRISVGLALLLGSVKWIRVIHRIGATARTLASQTAISP